MKIDTISSFYCSVFAIPQYFVADPGLIRGSGHEPGGRRKNQLVGALQRKRPFMDGSNEIYSLESHWLSMESFTNE
jgi:hypothetical protein